MRRTDHSSRGVISNVVRRCVWSRNLKNEEAMASVGPQRHKEYIYMKTEDKCDAVYGTAGCHIPEDYNFDIFHPENLQSVSPQNTLSLFTMCPRLSGFLIICAIS